MEHQEPLTGMRGVASLMVVGYHAVLFYWLAQMELGWTADAFQHPLSAWGLGGGWLGVDFFFVLSGFLLAGPLLRQAGALPAWPDYRLFAAKRLLRIAPPYYASFAVVYLLAGWSRHPLFEFTTEGLALHALYLHNFFPEHQFAINAVSWTLAVELQFYLLLPLMVIPFRRFGAGAALPFAALAILYLVWARDPVDPWNNRFLAFQFPAFLGHFGFGIAARRLTQARWRPRAHPDAVILAAFLALVLVPASWLGYTRQFEPVDVPLFYLFLRVSAALFFAILLVFALQPASRVGRVFTWRVLVWTGEASYSLYLVHYAVAGAFLVTRAESVFRQGLPAFAFIVTVTSLLVAAVFYGLVERPCQHLKGRMVERLSEPRPTA